MSAIGLADEPVEGTFTAEEAVHAVAGVFYWKPMMAVFRGAELVAYAAAPLRLRGPTLDLGCGDGRVGRLLRGCGLIEGPLTGVDIDAEGLAEAHHVGRHEQLVQGDAHRLPFADDSFASAFANGVVSCIPAGAPPAIAEIHRVLMPGGVFAMTVPIAGFDDVLFWPRILRHISPAAAELYIRRLNARLTHYTILPLPRWETELRAAGFEIVDTRPFLGRRLGGLWSLLSMHVTRVMGATRLIGDRIGHERAADLFFWPFRSWFSRRIREDRRNGPPFGYALIVARKPSAPAQPEAR